MRSMPILLAIAAVIGMVGVCLLATDTQSRMMFLRGGSPGPLGRPPCGPDPLPSYVTAAFPGAASLACESFYDNFTNINTIDVGNTRDPGYTWYRYNGYLANYTYALVHDVPIPTTYTITSNGVEMVLSSYGSGFQRFYILSNCTWHDDGTFVGRSLGGRSNYTEIGFANTAEGAANGGLAYYAGNGFTDPVNYPGSLDHEPELDWMNNESNGGTAAQVYFDWSAWYSSLHYNGGGFPGGYISNKQFGMLTINATENSGQGVVMGFLSGTQMSYLPWRVSSTPGFTVTGSTSGTTLTTTTTPTAPILPGAVLTGAGLTGNPLQVTAQVDATHYTINTSQTVASTAITGAYGTYEGSVFPVCMAWEIPYSPTPLSTQYSVRYFRQWTLN